MVTTGDIETFWRDGVVCLRGVLPRQLLEAMAAPVEAAIASEQSADLSALAGAPSSGARFVAGVDHWRGQPEMRAFACDTPLPAIVAGLLRSTNVWLYEDSVLVKEPGAAEATEWHQDLGYFHVDGTQLCTTWCPLDPVDAQSGAMRFVRASHRFPETYQPNLFVTRDPIPGTEGEPVPDVDAGAFEVVSFSLEPGDITVHHARTLHAAGPNHSPDRRRRAISVRYCGDDARVHFRPGAPRKAEQRDLHDGDPLGGAAHPQVWPLEPSSSGAG
jgi:ectoine hydroxylase-related dioxygenase (phytanoyl-CoA dioxygenase family)